MIVYHELYLSLLFSEVAYPYTVYRVIRRHDLKNKPTVDFYHDDFKCPAPSWAQSVVIAILAGNPDNAALFNPECGIRLIESVVDHLVSMHKKRRKK